ncbi:hypothetical protein AQJ43_36935 [Streptomyces avermitilis]|uniref:Uncharacterized protein n=2 Tax=Streptomyces avermitilis TaxID=33903 RepID=A0A143SZH0_STRAW|nr:hypothetical protein [Streptomyces avermitilis]KUN47869.1 hypothetical protein AQJ43_36935 [Streptomyces avermitilis]BAU77449.1 hypothetical protein SAVERM_2p005 [Streptomyces avermitilis MA-4680 = NBRC 14893]GDY70118.1 hypothetical protein SAV14893_095110 [Streptomyces avermitilis]GDY80411.1 hypothetical protein SAV31267_098960 [Streptomyces avermitilis]
MTVNNAPRYGKAEASAWDRGPRFTHRLAWIDLDGELSLVEGTLIRLKVDHSPGDRDVPPVWAVVLSDRRRPRRWRLRLVVLPAPIRLGAHVPLFKQFLGWTRPRLRSPEDADRWTWRVIVAHTQLRLAAPIAVDQRKPWEKTTRTSTALTPTGVRRGFRNIRPHLGSPAERRERARIRSEKGIRWGGRPLTAAA